MQTIETIDERIVQIADILEQIKSVDSILNLHKQKDNPQDMMLLQYDYRRKKFLKELRTLLSALNIKVADLAA